MARMPVHVYEDKGFGRVVMAGEVHGEDIVEAAHALLTHPRWRTSFDVIWDGRGVTSLILEPDDLAKMVEAKAEVTAGKEVTIAVRTLDKEMAKLCTLLLRVRGREVKVVGTLDEALAEVGLEEMPDF